MGKPQIKCVACGRYLPATSAGAATCSTCPCIYHKGCVAIPDSVAVAKDWTCPECKKKQRRGDNSSTPAKSVCGAISTSSGHESDTAASIQTENVPTQPPTLPSPLPLDAEVREMRRDLAKYMAEQREFRQDVRASIAGLGERMDGFERRLEAVEKKEISPGASEVAELQQTVSHLEQELNDRDQEALLSDLDIGQLPEATGESILHTITILAAKLGVHLEDQDIVFAERVGAVGWNGSRDSGAPAAGAAAAAGRPRRVIVRLARRRLRDELLVAARVRRNFTTADMGLMGPARRVYVNERLTRTNRQLFHRAREECRKRQ